jgi:hypothetical protein
MIRIGKVAASVCVTQDFSCHLIPDFVADLAYAKIEAPPEERQGPGAHPGATWRGARAHGERRRSDGGYRSHGSEVPGTVWRRAAGRIHAGTDEHGGQAATGRGLTPQPLLTTRRRNGSSPVQENIDWTQSLVQSARWHGDSFAGPDSSTAWSNQGPENQNPARGGGWHTGEPGSLMCGNTEIP